MAKAKSIKTDQKDPLEFGVKRDFVCELFMPPLPKKGFAESDQSKGVEFAVAEELFF